MTSDPRHAAASRRRRGLTAIAVTIAVTAAGCDDETPSGSSGASGSTATSTSSPTTSSTLPTGIGRVPGLVDEVEPSVVAIAVDVDGRIGQGSGVIVGSDGLIATNAHVVAGADEIEVVLADGSRLAGDVTATDAFTDLALVRIDRTDLPAVTLEEGYPDVGELAVAVGNPLGFDNTVTAGIVSGLQRSLPPSLTAGSQALVDLIQTDAAISPGNSGGALVAADGEVIGITVAYVPPDVGAVSLGFAIPSPTVRDVIDDLLADGQADHAYLGVQLASVTPQIAQRLDLERERGAVVLDVQPGTPAAASDLAESDLVIAIDGTEIGTVGDFLTQLRRFEPGDTVELTVERDGARITVSVVLGDRPQS